MTSPKTLEEMIAHVKKWPGWNMYPPDVEALGDRVDIATRIAEATGTDLEWGEHGTPRFMPKDQAMADSIKEGWKRLGLDVANYPAPVKRYS